MDESIRQRKKRWLNRYNKNRETVRRLKEKINTLDNKITNIKTSNLSGMPRGGQPKTSEDFIADKLELESRIERLELKGREYRHEILETIDNLEEATHAEILESLFIYGESLEDIGEALGYNLRHTYRLYARAMDAVIIPNMDYCMISE